MDRKAWFFVVVCAIGLGVNGWWMVKHPPPPPTPPVETAPATPAAATAPAQIAGAPGAATAPGASTAADAPEQKFQLQNDAAVYTFTSRGGGILTAMLLDTHDHVELNQRAKAPLGMVNSTPTAWDDMNYRVVEQTAKSIAFEAEAPDHLLIRKEYQFTEGTGSDPHLLNFKLKFTNKSGAKLTRGGFYLYAGAAASLRPDEIYKPAFCWNDAGDAVSKEISYFGSQWFGFGTTVTELNQSLEKMRWAGVTSRFYAQLISTKEDQPAKIWAQPFAVDHRMDEFSANPSSAKDQGIQGGIIFPSVDLDANESKSYDLRIYQGPKIYKELAAIDNTDPDRQHRYVMFYGMFTPVSRFLVWMLRMFHDWVSNWGAAIIMLTLFIRCVLWPVQARSNSAMKRMSALSPKIKELQAKYKDDPQKVGPETMKLYREYGVNPIGGCLPMVVQIPIFFGFFSVLRYAAELRGQHFLWVHDLSMPDTVGQVFGFPLNPLPLVMGLSSFLQMRLTPQPPNADRTQANILKFMPLMFLWFSYNFASALALYWTTQNVFSIFQAQIQRRFQKEPTELKKKVVTERARQSFFSPRPAAGNGKAYKKKGFTPRLGGGSSKSTRKDT